MNSVNLIGRLTRDPEADKTEGKGTSVSNMRIAVPRPPRGGEEQPAMYYTVVAYGSLADVCNEHLEKGREVAVQGRLDQREWRDSDDNRREVIEIVAGSVDFLRPAKSNQEPAAVGASTEAKGDDDIPF